MEIRLMVKNDLEFFNSVRVKSFMFLHDNTNYTLEDNIKWFETLKDPFYIVSIDGESIGYFRTSNWIDNSLYLGLDISIKHRGNGYAFKAYNLFFNKLKSSFNINKIYLEVLSSNKRAIHLYNKLNFTIIDVLPYSDNHKSIKMELKL